MSRCTDPVRRFNRLTHELTQLLNVIRLFSSCFFMKYYISQRESKVEHFKWLRHTKHFRSLEYETVFFVTGLSIEKSKSKNKTNNTALLTHLNNANRQFKYTIWDNFIWCGWLSMVYHLKSNVWVKQSLLNML